MTDFERGMKEGRIDALLEEHTSRLNQINGNIGRFAAASEQLALTVRKGLEKLASEIRTLQEEGRLAEERVNVAATTLARETERRREELALTATAASTVAQTADRSFSKRERLSALVVSVTLGVASLYLAFH